MNIILLGSGRGSNARAILEAQRDGKLGDARVTHIICDQAQAPMLGLGAEFDVPARYLDPAPFKTKLDGEGEQRYIETIRKMAPDLIVLAGFMRVLKTPFISAFSNKIINLHPSLLPSFPGLDGIGQAFRRGVKITGCTVHYVTPEVDGGPIIAQAAVNIVDGETLEGLAAKMHAAEHALLPATIAKLSRIK